MATAVDFASRLINPQAIRNANHSAIVAYVSPSRPGSNFGAKPLTKVYADSVKAQGLQIVSNWQYGKPGGTAPSDWTTGFQGGVDQANQANANHLAAGGDPNAPIFFSVDENISLAQWNDTTVEYFRGVNSVLGTKRTGVYGSSVVCSWAIQDGVVGRSSSPGKYWAWQTRAWSGTEIEAGAVLYQNVIDTASQPGPQIDGTAVDVSEILAEDYGQWFYVRPETPAVVAPYFQEIDFYANSNSSRNGARVRNGLGHTQEGGAEDGSQAESLALYLSNTNNQVSYHDVIGAGRVFHVAPKDRSSWSVLDANPYTINYCIAGSRAAWSVDQWLQREGDLRIMAFLMVRDAQANGYATEVIAPPYHVADGLSDHKYVTQALGIGTHTDLGFNFPWEIFAGWVNEYIVGASVGPKYNAINDVAAQNPWLGARLNGDAEITAPDQVGKFVEFENGSVYWSPSSHAHPVPTAPIGPSIMKTWASQGWETGFLGYPVTDPTEIASGKVQGFQGGAVYLQTGAKDGFIVKGEIRARWNKQGYENGPLGWPVSNEQPWDTGVVQDFENGRLFWVPNPTTIAVMDNNKQLGDQNG